MWYRPSARIGANKRSKSMWFTIATCFEADAARVEFVVFQQDSAPSHRAKYTVAVLDQETPDFIPPALWLPDFWPQPSWLVTTPCGVCFKSESIVQRSCTSTNWNDASTATGPLWVTRLLNVLLKSGLTVYAVAFALEPGGGHFEHTL